MSYFPAPKGLIPGSPEYNAAMVAKAMGATIRINGEVYQVEGTPPNPEADARDAANLAKFHESGSTAYESGINSFNSAAVVSNGRPNT